MLRPRFGSQCWIQAYSKMLHFLSELPTVCPNIWVISRQPYLLSVKPLEKQGKKEENVEYS